MAKPKNHWWFKFEWARWLGARDLHRCSLETRGFWIECIALMEEAETWFLEGTMAELANLIGCSPVIVKRSVDDLERNNAAEIMRTKVQKNAKSQEIVKIVSRHILKRVNLKEYNKLAKRKERQRKNVKPMSSFPSKELEIKSLRVLEKKSITNVENKKREEGNLTPFEPDRFSHPAVVVFEEIFGFKTGSHFATAVAQKVKNLDAWKTLLDNKRAFADKPLPERKRVCNWILDEYDKRITENQNAAHRNTGIAGQAGTRATSTDRLEQYGSVIDQYPTEADLGNIA